MVFLFIELRRRGSIIVGEQEVLGGGDVIVCHLPKGHVLNPKRPYDSADLFIGKWYRLVNIRTFKKPPKASGKKFSEKMKARLNLRDQWSLAGFLEFF